MEARAPQNNRMYFLDNLRSFIILLVIIFHVALGYMSPPLEWWYVVDIKTSPIFTVFVMDVDVFIMPVMFLIAGYFTVPVLQRKGIVKFFRNKLIRIGLPWLVGVLLLAPAITYMIWFSRSNTPPAYLMYWQTMFFSPTVFNHAHYWFLGVLFYFYLIVGGVYKLQPMLLQIKTKPAMPSFFFFILFGLFTMAAFLIPNLFMPADIWFSKLYIISFQPTRILLYFAYFLLGIYAWRNSWFTSSGYRPSLIHWLIAAGSMLILFTLYRSTIPIPPTLLLKTGHAALHSFFCLSMVFSLLAIFYNGMQSNSYIWRRLSVSSYTIYYIHQLIVLPVTYIVQKIDMPVGPKYLVVATTCVTLCYCAAEVLSMIKSRIFPEKPATPPLNSVTGCPK